MGHEHRISCGLCKSFVKKVKETATIVYFAYKCGRTTYNRSKGL